MLVFRQWEEQLIESVEEQPLDRKKLESMPGITVYIVKAGDTLWDIAKKFYTTVDEISGVNSLTEKEVKPGQSLILVRQDDNEKKFPEKMKTPILKTKKK